MDSWPQNPTIGLMPAEAARRWPDREALVFEGRRWTYRELDDEIARVARALIGIGVGRGDHVALWLSSKPQFIFLFFAIIRIGAVAVPMSTRYRRIEVEHVLRRLDCAVLILSPQVGSADLAALAREVLGLDANPAAGGKVAVADFPTLRRIILAEPGDMPGALSWDDFLGHADDAPIGEVARRAQAVSPDDMALICQTSGSTGLPKGAMLNHRVIRLGFDRTATQGFAESDVHIHFLPLFHSFGLLVLTFHSILTGGRIVLLDRFDAAEVVRLVDREKATTLHGFDTHYRDILAFGDLHPEYDLGSLRFALFPAGPESLSGIVEEVNRRLCPTGSGYGLTETSTTVTATPGDATLDQRARASGMPMPGVELRILDPDTGRDLPPDAPGEILVRYYGLMTGYYKQPGATAEALDAAGWLHTGDMGLLRPDGHLRYLGRYKDLIKVGGESVSPAEIEHLLLRMEGVAEIAVVAAPDPRLREVPAAFVVPEPGATITLEAVERFCTGQIASYKVPRRVIAVDTLPRLPDGKVFRRALRERLAETG